METAIVEQLTATEKCFLRYSCCLTIIKCYKAPNKALTLCASLFVSFVAQMHLVFLTLYLQVSSVDNFAYSFDPDQVRQNVRPDLYPICLTLRLYNY